MVAGSAYDKTVIWLINHSIPAMAHHGALPNFASMASLICICQEDVRYEVVLVEEPFFTSSGCKVTAI